MPPEQACGNHKGVTTASDVYSLGAVFYELLTGRPPFKGATQLDTLMSVVSEEPPRPRQLNPQIDRDLETICLKCLEKEPARRYGSADAVAEDLEHWLRGEPIRARPATPLERFGKWVRRRPALAALAGVVCLAALLGVAGLVAGLVVIAGKEREALAAKAATEDALGQAQEARGRAEDALIQLKQTMEHKQKLSDELRDEHDRTRQLLASARQTGYLQAVVLAGRELEGQRTGKVEELLGSNNADLRSWEWHRLHRMAFPERLALRHPGAATCFWAAGGRELVTLATAEDGGAELKVWSAADGRPLRSVEVLPAAGRLPGPAPAVSPDGGRVVILPGAGEPGAPRPVPAPLLADLAAGTLIPLHVEDNDAPFRSAWWSPDGKRLACVHEDNTITVWEPIGVTRRLRLVNGPAATLVTTAAGPFRFRCEGAHVDYQGRAKSGSRATAPFERIVWSPDGGRLLAITGGPAGAEYARLWDVRVEGAVRDVGLFLAAQGIRVNGCRFSPDSLVLAALWDSWLHADASGSAQTLVRGWNTATGEDAFRLAHAPDVSVGAFAWGPNSWLATAPAAGAATEDVKVWAGPTLSSGSAKEFMVCAGSGAARAVAFAPPGAPVPPPRNSGPYAGAPWHLAALSADGRTLRTYVPGDTTARAEIRTPGFLWQHDRPDGSPWSPDGRHLWAWAALASGSGESLPVAWTTGGDREVLAPKPRAGQFALFHWSPDGRRVVTMEEGVARVWDLPEPPPAVAAEGAWSPDGQHFAGLSAGNEMSVTVTDLAGRALHYGDHQGGAVGAVAWSRGPGPRRLATAAADRSVKVWDADSGRLLRSFPCPGLSPVVRLAWSAGDRRLIGIAGRYDSVRVFVWDADGGPDPVLTLAGFQFYNTDWASTRANVRLSADGSTLATCAFQRLASPTAAAPDTIYMYTSVWDVNAGRLLLTVSAQYGAEYLALSPDGSRLALSVAGSDRRYAVQTWDVRGQKQLGTLKVANGNGGLEFSPDGRRLAFRPNGTSARVDVHDAITGDLVTRGAAPFTMPNDPVIRWSTDGKRLLLSHSSQFQPRWETWVVDAETGALPAALKPEPSETLVQPPVWSPDGSLVVAAVWNRLRKMSRPDVEPPVRLVAWDGTTGKRLGPLAGALNDGCWDLAWSPDGRSLAAACQDRTARVWAVGGLSAKSDRAALDAAGIVRVLDGHAGDRGPGAVSELIAFYAQYQSAEPDAAAAALRAVAWRRDGRLIASAARRTMTVNGKTVAVGKVHLWDPITGRRVAVIDAPALALGWSEDGGRLAVLGTAAGGDALRVSVWDVPAGEAPQAVERGGFDVPGQDKGDPNGRFQVRFSPDGQQLAVITPAAAGVWDVASGRRRMELPAGVRGVDWRPDGERLLVVSAAPGTAAVAVRDAAGGQVLRTIRPPLGQFKAAVWTPDGRRVVTVTTEKSVAVWDPESNTKLLEMPGDATALSWARDGRTLLGSGAGLQRWESGGHDAP
jgi:WD40 repeat protein